MTVKNTTKEAEEFPLGVLVEAMAFGSSGAIERQEKQGQAELVDGDELPVDLGGEEGMFRQFGFVLGLPVPGDPIFRTATLPPGWKKVPTDHAMWSKIVDEQGRERVMVFYKAAFYDRSAHAHLTRRYCVDQRGERYDDGHHVVDRKTGKVLFAPPDGDYRACADYLRNMAGRLTANSLVEEWNAP